LRPENDRGHPTHSSVILERHLTTLGQVSARIEIDGSLIDRVGLFLKHEHDKVKVAAMKAIAHFAGSKYLQSQDDIEKLMEVILSVEKIDETPMQIAMGTAVVGLATGIKPSGKFDKKLENIQLRNEVVDKVITRKGF
jgi:hypothetical protein